MGEPASPSLRRSRSPPNDATCESREEPPAKRTGIRGFFAAGEAQRPPERTPSVWPPFRDDALLCVDLFCGIGGWSTGARLAGHKIVLAVDSDPVIMKLHMMNHPDTAHKVMKLGDDTEDELVGLIRSFIPEGSRWCLHGSPPCQTISSIQRIMPTQHRPDSAVGLDLAAWYLRFVTRIQPTYWTFEDVVHPELDGALRLFRCLYPEIMQYSKVDCADYGVCQHRKRMLAGSPSIMQTFFTDPSLRQQHPLLRDVLQLPEGAAFQRSSAGRNPDTSQNVLEADGSYSNPTVRRDVRPVDAISWTCMARHPHAYLRHDLSVIRDQTPRETALLQTFPSTYKLPKQSFSNFVLQKGAGNALPPLVARKMLQGFSGAAASVSS